MFTREIMANTEESAIIVVCKPFAASPFARTCPRYLRKNQVSNKPQKKSERSINQQVGSNHVHTLEHPQPRPPGTIVSSPSQHIGTSSQFLSGLRLVPPRWKTVAVVMKLVNIHKQHIYDKFNCLSEETCLSDYQ